MTTTPVTPELGEVEPEPEFEPPDEPLEPELEFEPLLLPGRLALGGLDDELLVSQLESKIAIAAVLKKKEIRNGFMPGVTTDLSPAMARINPFFPLADNFDGHLVAADLAQDSCAGPTTERFVRLLGRDCRDPAVTHVERVDDIS